MSNDFDRIHPCSSIRFRLSCKTIGSGLCALCTSTALGMGNKTSNPIGNNGCWWHIVWIYEPSSSFHNTHTMRLMNWNGTTVEMSSTAPMNGWGARARATEMEHITISEQNKKKYDDCNVVIWRWIIMNWTERKSLYLCFIKLFCCRCCCWCCWQRDFDGLAADSSFWPSFFSFYSFERVMNVVRFVAFRENDGIRNVINISFEYKFK